MRMFAGSEAAFQGRVNSDKTSLFYTALKSNSQPWLVHEQIEILQTKIEYREAKRK